MRLVFRRVEEAVAGNVALAGRPLCYFFRGVARTNGDAAGSTHWGGFVYTAGEMRRRSIGFPCIRTGMTSCLNVWRTNNGNSLLLYDVDYI
jgi:hypothetical protein